MDDKQTSEVIGRDEGDQGVRQRLSRFEEWAVGQISSHNDLAGHQQARVKRRKAWEDGG